MEQKVLQIIFDKGDGKPSQICGIIFCRIFVAPLSYICRKNGLYVFWNLIDYTPVSIELVNKIIIMKVVKTSIILKKYYTKEKKCDKINKNFYDNFEKI